MQIFHCVIFYHHYHIIILSLYYSNHGDIITLLIVNSYKSELVEWLMTLSLITTHE